jgi:N-acylglucosamine-6-phosphate 2-epimerase
VSAVLERLRGGLVVSCQPVRGGPMDRPDIVAAMAQAAIAGGAAGVRVEGLADLRAVRAALDAPIIALVKRDDPTTAVKITPRVADAAALLEAGADIVAYDATARPRADAREAVLASILTGGGLAMADCATLDDARAALAGGAHILGTTLSGYADAPPPADGAPDLALVGAVSALGAFTMAEGRYDTPALAAAALRAGADAVTVGTALTRLEIMTRRFRDAIAPPCPAQPDPA